MEFSSVNHAKSARQRISFVTPNRRSQAMSKPTQRSAFIFAPLPIPLPVLSACVCAAAAGMMRLFFTRRVRRRVALSIRRFKRGKGAYTFASAPASNPSQLTLSDASKLSYAQYGQLSGLQRRKLMEDALESAYVKSVQRENEIREKREEQKRVREEEAKRKRGLVATGEVNTWWDTQTLFWKMLESANGRAAALGFVLCLMREVVEPGHPSLYEQVVDVVVPIAQSTPPFLVAMVDRITDLLT